MGILIITVKNTKARSGATDETTDEATDGVGVNNHKEALKLITFILYYAYYNTFEEPLNEHLYQQILDVQSEKSSMSFALTLGEMLKVMNKQSESIAEDSTLTQTQGAVAKRENSHVIAELSRMMAQELEGELFEGLNSGVIRKANAGLNAQVHKLRIEAASEANVRSDNNIGANGNKPIKKGSIESIHKNYEEKYKLYNLFNQEKYMYIILALKTISANVEGHNNNLLYKLTLQNAYHDNINKMTNHEDPKTSANALEPRTYVVGIDRNVVEAAASVVIAILTSPIWIPVGTSAVVLAGTVVTSSAVLTGIVWLIINTMIIRFPSYAPLTLMRSVANVLNEQAEQADKDDANILVKALAKVATDLVKKADNRAAAKNAAKTVAEKKRALINKQKDEIAVKAATAAAVAAAAAATEAEAAAAVATAVVAVIAATTVDAPVGTVNAPVGTVNAPVGTVNAPVGTVANTLQLDAIGAGLGMKMRQSLMMAWEAALVAGAAGATAMGARAVEAVEAMEAVEAVEDEAAEAAVEAAEEEAAEEEAAEEEAAAAAMAAAGVGIDFSKRSESRGRLSNDEYRQLLEGLPEEEILDMLRLRERLAEVTSDKMPAQERPQPAQPTQERPQPTPVERTAQAAKVADAYVAMGAMAATEDATETDADAATATIAAVAAVEAAMEVAEKETKEAETKKVKAYKQVKVAKNEASAAEGSEEDSRAGAAAARAAAAEAAKATVRAAEREAGETVAARGVEVKARVVVADAGAKQAAASAAEAVAKAAAVREEVARAATAAAKQAAASAAEAAEGASSAAEGASAAVKAAKVATMGLNVTGEATEADAATAVTMAVAAITAATEEGV